MVDLSPAERKVRVNLVTLIRKAGIFGLKDGNLEQPFIDGRENPRLDSIGMDSLSQMELCIGIENEFGVAVVPSELEEMGTLEDLMTRISGQSGS
jgi:acyl carrier protein